MEPKTLGDMQKLANNLFNQRINSRASLERTWYRNILYYMGEQWIRWSKSQKGFVPQYRGGKRKRQPTPVDNVIRDHVRSIKAMILNKDFDITVWPNSNDRDDRNASKLGEDILADINARDDQISKDIEEEVALWMILTGTGFIRDYASKDRGQIIDIGNDRSIRTGDVVSENIIGFNLFVNDTIGSRLRDKPYFGIQSLKEKDWVADRFEDFDKDSGGDVQMINYQQTLAKMVGSVSPFKNTGQELISSGDVSTEDLVQYREIEFAPTRNYPKGRHVIMVGDQTISDVARLPIKTSDDGNWNYSVEDFRIIPVPGRFWGDSSINDLISPQNTINKIDQSLGKNRRSLGRTMVLGPKGLRLKKKSSQDAAILHLEYDVAEAKGQIPTVHQGVPLPGQTLEERAIQKEVVQDTSGDPKGVLRGKAPTSGASGVMVDILRETAEQGHAPDVNRYFRGLQRSYRKRLVIAQELFTEKRMLKIAGSEGKVSVKHFTGADLRGNTDVRLELVSGMATTNAGRVQVMKDLTLAGIWNEQLTPPDIRDELLKKMKISGFKNKMAADAKRAEEENSVAANGDLGFYLEEQMVDLNGQPLPMMVSNPDTGEMEPATNQETGEPVLMLDESGQPPWIPVYDDPVFDVDDHQVHAETHRRFIISPEFSELEEHIQVTFMAHYEAHMRQIAEQMRLEQAHEQRMMAQEAQMQAMAKGPQGPGSPAPGGAPSPGGQA